MKTMRSVLMVMIVGAALMLIAVFLIPKKEDSILSFRTTLNNIARGHDDYRAAVDAVRRYANDNEGISLREEYRAGAGITGLTIRLKHVRAFIYVSESDRFEIYIAGKKPEKLTIDIHENTLSLIDNTTSLKKYLSIGNNKDEYGVAFGIPKSAALERFDISTGLGELHIDTVAANTLQIEGGIGQTVVRSVFAKNVTISAGIGEIDVKESQFSNAKIEMGIGAFSFEGVLLGKSVIEGGIGSTSLVIHAPRSNYYVRGESGIGTIRVNRQKTHFPLGTEIDAGERDAEHEIYIDGGIGEISIEFDQ